MTFFRFHCLALPHTQTTREYSNCAFTENVRKFCIIMKSLGHYVILYGSEDNEAPCDEFVPCITKKEQHALCGVSGPDTIVNAKYEHKAPQWEVFNSRIITEMGKRVKSRDFLAIIAGDLSDPIVKAFPQTIAVEHAVGYTGISHLTHKIFPSYAWMHTLYGKFYGGHGTRGRFHDRVIPHCIDPSDFTFSKEKDDYFLFVGRLNEDKGVRIAAAVAEKLHTRLVVAGQGDLIFEGTDYRGLVGVKERAQLMSRAKALFVPSLYLEPFGMVAIEGLISGAPLITTDWGGLSEINEHEVTGFRCHTLKDFIKAGENSGKINPEICHNKGLRYSLARVKYEHQDYFEDLFCSKLAI